MPILSPLGLYIHIPWCTARCGYCDFNTYLDGDQDLKARYQTALLREIVEAGTALERPSLETIFIGGGTPTTLTPEQLIELVEAVGANFQLRPTAEVTVEANPGTLSVAYLRALRQGGINRLSLGVQSFCDDELTFLGRLHEATTARRAFEQARAAGFENISLDLIFNLPQQSLPQWQFSLQEGLKLAPDHFSIYALIVEPGTPLQRHIAAGITPKPDDDLAADMYEATIDALGQAGYAQYEISNWATANGEANWQTPHLAAAHNLIYWRNQPYLGLGAGAFGTLNGRRWANHKRPQTYVSRVESGSGLGPAWNEETVETIDQATAMSEHMLLGLRLVREGVGAREFASRYGQSLSERFSEAITYGLERTLIEWIETPGGPRLRLTQPGRVVANQAIVQFVS